MLSVINDITALLTHLVHAMNTDLRAHILFRKSTIFADIAVKLIFLATTDTVLIIVLLT